METDLALRFKTLWSRCAENDSDVLPVWEALYAHYQEKHRYYHTLEHIAHCLGELDEAGDRIENRDAVELALWFHDVIFNVDLDRGDNEVLSADHFSRVARPVMPPPLVDLVVRLILATIHLDEPRTGDTAYMVDIDLSSFGLPWEEYLRDSNALQQEERVGDAVDFYRAKLRFLDALSARPAIFQTQFFRDRHERNARENIARYSSMLRERISDAG